MINIAVQAAAKTRRGHEFRISGDGITAFTLEPWIPFNELLPAMRIFFGHCRVLQCYGIKFAGEWTNFIPISKKIITGQEIRQIFKSFSLIGSKTLINQHNWSFKDYKRI
jgi:hypothetical protein